MKALFLAMSVLALSATAPSSGRAQSFGAAFAGFDSGSNDPIQIEADNLEVRDPEKLAIYSGNVKVRQGATLMETPELKVFYTGNPTAPDAAAANGKPAAGGTTAARAKPAAPGSGSPAKGAAPGGGAA